MAKKKRRKKKEEYEKYEDEGYDEGEGWQMRSETRQGILIVFLFVAVAISVLSLFDLAGGFGRYVDQGLSAVFGWSRWAFPVVVAVIGYMMLRRSKYRLTVGSYIGLLLIIAAANGLLHHLFSMEESLDIIYQGRGGGYVGFFASFPLRKIMGSGASVIILFATIIVGLLIMLNTSLQALVGAPQNKLGFLQNLKLYLQARRHRSKDDDEEEKEVDDYEKGEEESAEENYEEAESVNDEQTIDEEDTNKTRESEELEDLASVKKQLPKIDLPIKLLDRGGEKPTSGDIRKSQEIIRQTLKNFNIEVEMGEVSVGPTVTQYTFKPADGVKLTRITSLQNDLALALAAHPVRMEAPIPGKSLIGLEVPNESVATVHLRELLDTKDFKNRKTNLAVPLGKDVSGKPWFADLASMPHLLVAGATGSGKSVALNSIIVSLLYQNNPEDLKFIMVDPKRVELPIYNDIPYLLTPVVTDVKKTINALKWTISEMDRRYDLLSKLKKRNITSYNATAKEKLPYIVFIIDELADLMTTSASDVEGAIIRLAQMARAVGIHLILATQRPSVDVITGLIKANITSRIAFSVASLMDSRTILDFSGAEKLIGKGDMLYISAQLSKPKRLQGAFLSDNEIKRVVDYVKGESTDEVQYEEGVTEKQTNGAGASFYGSNEDELFDEAREVVVAAGKASASLLQRRLKVGYARAARLLDLLEEAGIIGPSQGAKPREILKTDVDSGTMEAVEDALDEELEEGYEEDEEPKEEEPDEEEWEEPSDEEDEQDEYWEDEEEEEK